MTTTATIPNFIYGTAWKGARTADLVYTALRCGFRAIDSAAQPEHYNEPGAGDGLRRAVAEGLVQRQDVFIQSKFASPKNQRRTPPYNRHAPLVDMVRQSVESSLRSFTVPGQEPYLDSLLLHTPMENLLDTVTVWRTLESYVPHRIRNLGMCNVTLDVVRALHYRLYVKPAFIQNPFNVNGGFDADLRRYCRNEDMVYQSFWTLTANSALVQSQVVEYLAQMAGVHVVPAYFSLVLGLGSIAILNGTTQENSMIGDLQGVEKVFAWAQGEEGSAIWQLAMVEFKSLVGDADT
ncbi:hypothetical protein CP533_4282 [Ophiocordyceps camponoti-saundersi (nom. inval.)]|nr:hypothetical protein CP533_4282 [Ophiocordyceps camponoti-saundersi (nom. inval.)]